MERWLTEAGRLTIICVVANIGMAVLENPGWAILSVFFGVGFPGLLLFFGYFHYIVLYHYSQPVPLAMLSIFYNLMVYPICELIEVEKYPLINVGLFSLIILLEIIKQLIKK